MNKLKILPAWGRYTHILKTSVLPKLRVHMFPINITTNYFMELLLKFAWKINMPEHSGKHWKETYEGSCSLTFQPPLGLYKESSEDRGPERPAHRELLQSPEFGPNMFLHAVTKHWFYFIRNCADTKRTWVYPLRTAIQLGYVKSWLHWKTIQCPLRLLLNKSVVPPYHTQGHGVDITRRHQ